MFRAHEKASATWLLMKNPCRLISFGASACALCLVGCGGEAIRTASAPQPAGESPSAASEAIGSGRLAVRNECWYALDNAWLNNPTPSAPDEVGPQPGSKLDGYGNGAYMAKAGWSYLASPGGVDALQFVLDIARSGYGGFATDLILSTNGSLYGHDVPYWINAIVSPGYSLGISRIDAQTPLKYANVGRGLECPSFASLIIYRATGKAIPNLNAKTLYAKFNAKSLVPSTQASPGDVVFNPTLGVWGHTAICVRNVAGTLTMVDSNYVGTSSSNGYQEAIGRHEMPSGTSGWYTYSGQGKWY